jgi:hypothetical protein
MKIALAILLIAHGFAHIVGFIVYWRISDFEEMTYKTTILNGKVNVKDTGIRIIGIVWLLLTICFIFIGIALIIGISLWEILALYISIISLLFCILCWPDSKIGVAVNILILIIIALNKYLLFIT